MLDFQPKQKEAIEAVNIDTLLLGGARGGGKSYALVCKMALEIVEWYSEVEIKRLKIDVSQGFRVTSANDDYEQTYYYKYLIDYPDYFGVIVRRTEPALLAQTQKECKKVYPLLGGVWSKGQWTFPSGAMIMFRPCQRPEHLDWFQGQNVHRLAIEELTQFDQWEVEEMESCCRSSHKHIKAMKVYTTNPGKRGHVWVKKKYIDNCPAIPEGAPVWVEKYGIKYQPTRSNKVFVSKTGERFLFIPSLVFDNKYLSERDDNFVRNLLGKNKILKEMWLYGNWNVFAGQFFEMWREDVHVKSELAFFNATDKADLIEKRRNFDWTDWRLYMSNDYGFAERSAWACGFYAVHNSSGDIVKFAEIVQSGLTIKQQARYTKEFIKRFYDLEIDDFEIVVADPKSYWQRQDKGEDFWDFATAYQEEGIHLTKGLNDREAGAMAFLEVLRIREDGTPQMTFLDCCKETVESIPNLPADPKNLNDVDTTVFDHPYDEGRYFLMVLRGQPYIEDSRESKEDWREMVRARKTKEEVPKSWRVA
ncbi:MAG: phage terminase large subunit [Bacteroidales bacterium]|jgi:hypothetical protein|nr:phage terminase large subunit [Bacteroidales bacterium]